MPKREVYRKFGVSNEIKVISKDCKHLSQYAINKLNNYLTHIIESDKKSIEINISNEVIKYCYKADNFYDFEHRVYLLSKFIKRKLKQELNTYETKKA